MIFMLTLKHNRTGYIEELRGSPKSDNGGILSPLVFVVIFNLFSSTSAS